MEIDIFFKNAKPKYFFLQSFYLKNVLIYLLTSSKSVDF
jgi:hypothetical protein